jgi:hypothetical protein
MGGKKKTNGAINSSYSPGLGLCPTDIGGVATGIYHLSLNQLLPMGSATH